MVRKLGVVMDPIESITPAKDTSFAMMLAAQARGFELHCMTQADLWLQQGKVWARSRILRVQDDAQDWFTVIGEQVAELSALDVILMRKDPPFDTEYIYTTYLLELAQAEGVRVINDPKSLRDANEKLFTAWFPECTPAQLVTRRADLLKAFIAQHQDAVLKPLHGMGGGSIFRLQADDHNTNVVIETLTQQGTAYIMAQQYLPEISVGDKRIILIDGQPVPYGLLRIPSAGDIRGNLAAGGRGVGVELTERDYWLCERIGPTLKEKGLLFVGLDVIGDYVTEINVTSPTCVREIDAAFGLTIADQFIALIERQLN